jgi:hypothetical protein
VARTARRESAGDGAHLAAASAPSRSAAPTEATEATEAAEPAGSGGEVSATEAVTPRPLSLDELGVGAFNPFVGD